MIKQKCQHTLQTFYNENIKKRENEIKRCLDPTTAKSLLVADSH